MKKWIYSLIILLSFSCFCFAGPGDTMKASEDFTADRLFYTGKMNLYSLFFVTDGTNALTVNLYDGTDATGKSLVPEFVFPADADNLNQTISFFPPLQLFTGLYVDITTAGTVTYKIYYSKDNL